MAVLVDRGPHHVAEDLGQEIKARLAVGRYKRVDVDDLSDAVRTSIGGAGDGHPPVTGAAQHHVTEILEIQHRNQVLHVSGHPHRGSQVRSLAHARQRGGEDVMTGPTKAVSDRRPLPAATKAAVHDHERRHTAKLLTRGGSLAGRRSQPWRSLSKRVLGVTRARSLSQPDRSAGQLWDVLCYVIGVDRVVRWYRSARRHRIGKAHAMHVIASTEPTHLPASVTADARLVWIGLDDRGIELEIVALDLDDAVVVIHVMPTSLRR